MSEETILLIERGGGRAPSFAQALIRKGYHVEVFTTGKLAVEAADRLSPVVVILNAASLGSSGKRICASLNRSCESPIIHICQPNDPVDDGADATCDVTLRLPFTARKLVNRIRRLWPVDRTDVLQVGSVQFVKKTRVVRVGDNESRLTPKAAQLLEVFMRHPCKTLDRAFLMQQVWDTNYMGDTRTLDVHVRWVRQAIEPDPRAPVYIRTIRRQGYYFDPEPDENK
nr:response regulator transcription factor [Anaerolineae bacterium]